MRHPGLPESAKVALRRCGLSWTLVRRSNHDTVVVDGRVVVTIGRSAPGSRNEKNLLAQIRRFARGIDTAKKKDS